jgi:hypothetical protein
MRAVFARALAATGLAFATQASAQITFYEHAGFRGQSATVDRPAGNLERYGFNNRASSAVVSGEAWEVCTNPGFSGRCTVLNPGRHDSLGQMNDGITSARPVSARGGPGSPPSSSGGQITLYDQKDFRGRSVAAYAPIGNFEGSGLDNRASSVAISGGSWEVCDGPGFSGRCAVLRPGRYASLNEIGLNNRISSARPVVAGAPPSGGGHVTLYEHAEFRGHSVAIDRPADQLNRYGFSNAASSAVVTGRSWELCDRAGFGGRCVVLRPGRYPNLGAMGMNDSVTSLRPAR